MRKVALIGILILVSTGFLGCKEKVKPGVTEVKREQVSGIVAETITPSPVDEYYETSGTVRAKTVSVIASRMMGTVKGIRVREGDRVGAGQVLLTVDDSDVVQKVRGAGEGYNEALKALEAAGENKNLAEITYQRYKKLYGEKALSGQELDRIETQKKVADIDYERALAMVGRAEAGMNEAKVFHGFTRITSPVKGIVTEKKIEIGSMAAPGMPLLTVEDDSSYRIEVNGDEKLAGKIRSGMEAVVFVEALGREIKGQVTEVVPSVDPVSRSFLIKIALSGEGLRSGFYGKVSIPIGKKEVLLVPAKSVLEKGQLTGVYTVDEGSVIKYRLIRVGRKYVDKVEVLSGLNAGEKVIIDGVEKAIDGGVAVR